MNIAPLPALPRPGEKSGDRLYQRLARRLFDDIADGKYAVGDRLPAERELAIEFNSGRPTVREAMIALEVQGLVEVRVGSGAYVIRLPDEKDRPDFDVTAFELSEARLLFEGEAAALAATLITPDEIDLLDRLVQQIGDEQQRVSDSEDADREFHLVIARATRNAAIVDTIERFWRIRHTSPECALLHKKARAANVRPVAAEHYAIVDALRAHDSTAARAAMRAHLGEVIEHLLFATEEEAMSRTRRAAADNRARFARSAKL